VSRLRRPCSSAGAVRVKDSPAGGLDSGGALERGGDLRRDNRAAALEWQFLCAEGQWLCALTPTYHYTRDGHRDFSGNRDRSVVVIERVV
jgi:hypothetical protein